VFPKGAIVERLRWAGLSPDEFRFAQVTTFENTRATKPHPAYYLDIVHQLGRAPGSVLMVGNSRGADISPAQAAGLRTLHVCDASAAPFEASEWQLHEDVERALQSDAPSGSLRAVLQYLKNELS
jgi:FMN phosphatase YigB (HAD superfamily)